MNMELLFKGTRNLTEYHNSGTGVHVVAGGTVTVNDAVAKGLLADFPGIFIEAQKPLDFPAKDEVKIADVAKAPADKQIKHTFKRK
jgi:hypothetical protein